MSTAATACLDHENTTDCLLQALITLIEEQSEEKSSEFDWDPWTFAFTVPIGIFAALFTLVAIIQTVLAAGAGRRRSSKQVIGRWSSTRHTGWSWSEFRMLTVVSTPVLRTSTILELLEKESGDNVVYPSLAMPWYRRTFRMIERKSVEASQARWLSFLKELRLEDLPFNGWHMETTAADYLPDDLKAVPAYGEIGCIVALAVAAGMSFLKLDPHSLYPIIIGRRFQLDIREHPILGRVGVFAEYGRGKIGIERLPLRVMNPRVTLALQHAQGYVAVPRGTSIVFFNIHQPGDLWFINRKWVSVCRQQDVPSSLCPVAHYLIGTWSSTDAILWLLVANTPDDPPVIFPSRSIDMPAILSTFALQSKRFMRLMTQGGLRDVRSLFPRIFKIAPRSTLRSFEELPEDTHWINRDVIVQAIQLLQDTTGFENRWNTQSDDQKYVPRTDILFQVQQFDKFLDKAETGTSCRKAILHATTGALLDVKRAVAEGRLDVGRASTTESLEEAGLEPFGSISKVIGAHEETLRNLDRILPPLGADKDHKAHPKLGTLCEVLHLDGIIPSNKYWVPLFLDHLREIVEACKYRSSNNEKLPTGGEVPPDNGDTDTTGGEGAAAGMENIDPTDEDIDDVLIWRAIMIGLLFWTAPDNTNLLNSALWAQVIPLL